MKAKKGFEVTCRNATFAPTGQPDQKILDGVDLTIESGEFVAVVGGNGTGKSTLLAAIAGEIELTGGEITVGGQIITEPIHRRIDGVGIVHQQDEDDLLHAFSISMNVAFRQANNNCHPHFFWACSEKFRSSLAKKIAEHAPQLRADVNKLVGHLSGGLRQMFNLVIAIHLEHEQNPCRLILLDEHTSKLDHENAAMVMNFTKSQIEQSQATAIMVTHRYHDAVAFCDRVIVMGGGKIRQIFDNSRRDIKLEQVMHAVENAS